MAKLYIPKDCVFEGEISKIQYEGDILIENPMQTQAIESTAGSVVYRTGDETLDCSTIRAATGLSLRGATLKVSDLSGEEGEIEGTQIVVDHFHFSDHLAIKGEELHIQSIQAKSAVIEADSIHIDRLHIEGDLILRGRDLTVNETMAGKIVLSGNLKGERMTAIESVHQEQGSITVRFLDTRTYSAEDHVRGMVAISTAEDVRAAGVRGFLRPDEFNILSGTQNTMDPSAQAISSSPSEITSSPEPVDTAGSDEGWIVQAEPVERDPNILHHPNDPDQLDTRSIPTGELELVDEEMEDAFVPTHEFVPPKPAVAAVEETSEPSSDEATDLGFADEADEVAEYVGESGGESHEFSTNPTVEPEDGFEVDQMAEFEPAEVPDEATDVAGDTLDGGNDEEADYAVDADEEEGPVQELNTDDLAGFDAQFDDGMSDQFVVEDQEEEVHQADFEPAMVAAASGADLSADHFEAEAVAPVAVETTADVVGSAPMVTEVPEKNVEEVVRDVVADIRADDLVAPAETESAEPTQAGEFSAATDIDADSISDIEDYMTITGEDDEFEAPTPSDFGDIGSAGDPEDFQSVPEFGNTTDLEEMSPEITAEDLEDDSQDVTEDLTAVAVEAGESSDPDALDDSGNSSAESMGMGGELNQTALSQKLTEILDQIRAFFPEKNYPKFVGQIQRYVEERRFKILAKERNKEAVLARIDKMDHEEISQLARHFYSTLDDALQ